MAERLPFGPFTRPDQGSAPGLYGSEVEIEGRQLHDPEGGIL